MKHFKGDVHMSKSHVGMGVDVCPICLKEHNETVLIHTKLANKLDPKNFTGWDLCPECKQFQSEGYVAIIECENANPTLENAVRTGNIARLKKHVWDRVFNTSCGEYPFVFCQKGVIDRLQE